MSERKVLNKYYPPDFDPSKIPRVKGSKNRNFNLRLMAPCNMKCLTCGEYIAKAKKFNSRKEDADETYLGLRIYRFYIKCPGCLAEISFRTDPPNTEYVLEAGATRNFQALKLAEEQAAREEREAREEIESNPMLLLENRTLQSQYEMDGIEQLEELKELNDKHAGVDIESMTEIYEKQRQLTQQQVEENLEKEAKQLLGFTEIRGKWVKKLSPETLNHEHSNKKLKTKNYSNKPSFKSNLEGLVKIKKKSDTQPSNIEKSPATSSLSVLQGCYSDSSNSED